jgi:3-oxoacyl-[acyl-carrier protein] reductase
VPGQDNPVVLITGANSGIGRACALRFAASGYSVAINYVADEDAATQVARQARGIAYRADVSDAEAVRNMVQEVEARQGPIEIAVANAGIYVESPLADMTDETWDRTLRVNLGGCYNLARAVVPQMRARGGGSIVFVASEMAFSGGINTCHYVASKAGILGLMRSLARELAPDIRVNSVAPGPVDTPFLPDRDRGRDTLDAIPLGRIGQPDEVADVIHLIAQSHWTTGAVWSVNGGLVIE